MNLRLLLPIALLGAVSAGAYVFLQQGAGSARGDAGSVDPSGMPRGEQSGPDESSLLSAAAPVPTAGEPSPEVPAVETPAKTATAVSDEEFLSQWKVPKNVDRLSYKVRSTPSSPEAKRRDAAEKVMSKVHAGELTLEDLTAADRAAYDGVMKERNDRRNARRAEKGLPPQNKTWPIKRRDR